MRIDNTCDMVCEGCEWETQPERCLEDFVRETKEICRMLASESRKE